MPIPDVNAWWTAQQQRLPGLGGLPSLTGADAAGQWESVAPQRSALYDLYQQDMSNSAQAAPTTPGQGQAPAPMAGLPEGGSALGQMLASVVGASRSSMTPLAGLPTSVGATNYSYQLNPGDTGYVAPTSGVGAGAPAGMVWSDELHQFIPQTPVTPPPTEPPAEGEGDGTTPPADGGTTPPADGGTEPQPVPPGAQYAALLSLPPGGNQGVGLWHIEVINGVRYWVPNG